MTEQMINTNNLCNASLNSNVLRVKDNITTTLIITANNAHHSKGIKEVSAEVLDLIRERLKPS
jgi:hypothetical protein